MRSVVKLDHVTKVYTTLRGRTKTVAVSDVSFEINKGEVFSLLGPNGAGKTTIVRMLCGLLRPTRGEISIHGCDPIEYRKRHRATLGVVLEGNRGMYWRLSALENLTYFGTIWGEIDGKALRKRSHELLEFFGLYEVRNERVSDFSRGMQQKTALALALITDPSVLFLDEPTLGLDVRASIEMKKLITELARERDKTILLTTHQLGMAEELSDRVAILNRGHLLAVDRVPNLAALWSTSWYQFVVEGEIASPLLEKLGQVAPLVKNQYDGDTNSTTLVFELQDPLLFYRMIEKLQQGGVVTVSAVRVDPDLEDIFLRLTQD